MFTPVLAKHTRSFNLVDMVSADVNRIQRNFEPLQRQVETWRKKQITETAKLIFYSAFLDGKLEAPRTAARSAPAVFRTAVPEFAARPGGHYFPILTTWSTPLFEDQFPSGSRIKIEFTSA